MTWTIGGSLVLCLFGCLISALMARLTRGSSLPRKIRAAIAALLLCWVSVVGMHGLAVTPAFVVIGNAARILAGPDVVADRAFLVVTIVSFLAVFFTHLFFARTPKELHDV
jgi:hypothetical protein